MEPRLISEKYIKKLIKRKYNQNNFFHDNMGILILLGLFSITLFLKYRDVQENRKNKNN
jgi:uncharacterized membrane protein